MKQGKAFVAAALTLLLLLATENALAADATEPPALAEQIESGALPPLAERLPDPPFIDPLDRPWQSPGRYGGRLRMLMAKPRDLRQLVVYGYARLVGYTPDLELRPDILEAIEVEEGRIFTLRLRKGHRWSDGHPFTSKDFRYWWENMAQSEDLNPSGPPIGLMVEGHLPVVEFPDETTVRYTWPRPHPTFLQQLARPNPIYLYAPAHYLKQFHPRYADPEELQAKVEEAQQRNWASLHNRKDNLYKNDNIELPTLQPWFNTTRAPSERFVLKRNPYFHRVDPQGRQLPYIDEVVVQIAASSIIPAKTGTGDSDLQARYIRFDNYTFLKEAEQDESFRVSLWQTALGARLALYPNLNVKDPAYRALFRDVRFRRALSLAIHRFELNQVVYYGLGLEGNNTVLPDSPLYEESYRDRWTAFDLEEANRLLDEIGLTERDGRDVRLLPDGRPLDIIVETAGESTEETDVLELIRDSWANVGIALYTKPSQREVFRNRVFSGETQIAIWAGMENGLPNPDMSPKGLAPTSQNSLQWPRWGQYVETKGRSGEPPDMQIGKTLMTLYKRWLDAKDRAERAAIWHEMLTIHADQVLTIGLVAGIPQPVVISKALRNIPEVGLYNWDPGSFFGIYHPDSFWLAPEAGE